MTSSTVRPTSGTWTLSSPSTQMTVDSDPFVPSVNM
jgi:hypothetical protein